MIPIAKRYSRNWPTKVIFHFVKQW